MESKKYKLHIDTDIGCDVDDMCALIYMLKKASVEVVGITTTLECGGRRTRYVNHLLQRMGRADIPVGAGKNSSFNGQPTPNTVFENESRMFDAQVLAALPATLTAEEVMENSLAQGAVFAAIGTLTNFASFGQTHGSRFNKNNLFVMGGSYTPPGAGYPDWRQHNDWNFNMDLPAAQFMFENSSFTLVEIAPTLQVFLTKRDCEKLAATDELGALVANQAYWWSDAMSFIKEAAQQACLPKDLCNFHYDPLTCAIATGFSDYQSTCLGLRLLSDDVLGYRLMAAEGSDKIRLIHAVDADSFHHEFMTVMTEQNRRHP